jgi:hypothetical protein
MLADINYQSARISARAARDPDIQSPASFRVNLSYAMAKEPGQGLYLNVSNVYRRRTKCFGGFACYISLSNTMNVATKTNDRQIQKAEA